MTPPPVSRPSHSHTPPDDVVDPLLYALAVDVAAAHQPDADGTCPNLQCRGRQAPCWALWTAHRAALAARRQNPAGPRTATAPDPQPVGHPFAAFRRPNAAGRAV